MRSTHKNIFAVVVKAMQAMVLYVSRCTIAKLTNNADRISIVSTIQLNRRISANAPLAIYQMVEDVEWI